MEGIMMYKQAELLWLVRETAPWGKQMGLQRVMQSLASEYPTESVTVRIMFSTYHGKPLKRDFHMHNGLYAPHNRKVTNWRDKDGKKVHTD